MSRLKSMILACLIVSLIISCKKEPNPVYPPGDINPSKVFVQFVDFISNEPISNLEISLWNNTYNNTSKSASLFTDNNGNCQFLESRSGRFLIPESNTYLPMKFSVLSPGITDNNELLVNPFRFEFLEKKGIDNYYRVKLFKKANTIIHLQQVNKYPSANSHVFITMSPYFYNQKSNSFKSYSSLDNIQPPFQGAILLKDSAMLDVKINVSMASDIENMITWHVYTYPPYVDYDFPPDWIVLKKESIRNIQLSANQSNEILIQF